MTASSSSFFDIEPLDCGETSRCAMDACSLCGKRLTGDCDIFMYRGDTPFCSEDCRNSQMVSDDARARKRPAMKKRRRHRHEAPAAAAAADPARVRIAANVPVAI